MSAIHDTDFVEPAEKHLHAFDPSDVPVQSQAAIVSLVCGILSFLVLPVVGAIVAVVTGHFALRQIRDGRGRIGGGAAARAGLTLGYCNLATGLVFLALLGLFMTRAASQPATVTHFSVTTPAPLTQVEVSERGVKMANELGKRDFEILKQAGLEHDPEEIVAFYNLSQTASDPELALLTTSKITYIKEGRKTEFDLKDIESIKSARDLGSRTDLLGRVSYPIEAVRKNGSRMRISVSPQDDGISFSDALTSSWKAAQGNAAPKPTSR